MPAYTVSCASAYVIKELLNKVRSELVFRIFAAVNQKTSKILKIVLSLSLAAVFLWFSFRGVDWGDFFSQIRACRWGYVVCSMLCGVLAFIFRGIRWQEILKPIDPSTRAMPAINAINISNLANMVIPYSGEFLRCGVITRHSERDPETGRPKATYDRVLGTAILERGWDVLSVAILMMVLLSFKWHQFGNFMVERIFRPIGEGLRGPTFWIAVAVLVILLNGIIAVYCLRNRSRFCRRVCDVFRHFVQGFASCFKMKDKGLFFLYTALIWLMYWLQMVLIKEALPAVSDLGVLDCLFLMLVGSFASVLPVPGGFGTFHYIVSTALLVLYGYPQAGVGIVFATLAHESQALTMLITGAASYLQETFTRKDR